MNPNNNLNQPGPSNANTGFSLRDIQMSNPRFLARHQEHQAKIHAESEKKQKDEKFQKDKLQQLEYTKMTFDDVIKNLYNYVNSKFTQGLMFSNFHQAEEAINPLKNLYITKLIESYDTYLKHMTEIQCYFDQSVRDKLEMEHNYDKHYKDAIMKLTNDLYEKIGIVQGFIYPSIIHDVKSIFDLLEKHGGPGVELFIDVDTDTLRKTYDDTVQGYLQAGYPAEVIEMQIREILGYDLADIQELEIMKIK